MDKIKFMNKDRVKEKVLSKLKKIAKNPNVKKILCSLETHLKEGAETPSSVTIKTNKKYIYPFYSSNSLNCGMGLLQTDLNLKEIENKIPKLFKEIDKKTTLSQFERFFGKKEITTTELKRILLKGVDAMPERYGKINNAFEYGGNLFKNNKYPAKMVLSSIPKFLWSGGRTEIGKNAGGNHFIELQTPEEIYDKSYGIKKGQVFFMVHLGTGYLGGNITGVYCHRPGMRKKTFYRMIVGPRFLIFKKILFLLKKYGPKFIIKNYRLLFNNNQLDRGISFDSKQSRDFFAAEYATMNYGYSWRYIVYNKLFKALSKITKKSVKGKLLLDKSHNSIFLKEESIYYNRNSCNMEKNDLFILSGDVSNHSYLFKAGEKMKEVDYNIDHGLGVLLNEDKNKTEKKEKIYRFRRRRYLKTNKFQHKIINLENSKNTFEFLKEMEQQGYFKIICKLRPIANLK